MFVTNPSFEQSVPRGLSAPGCRYWTGFGLTSPAAWFLVSYRTAVADGMILQTVGIAWELQLIDLIATVGHDAVLSLQQVAPESPFDGSWRMARVSELWTPSESEASRTGPLLLRVRGENHLRDPFAKEVADTGEGRQLLLKLPDWTR
jgi:hypothetical protein